MYFPTFGHTHDLSLDRMMPGPVKFPAPKGLNSVTISQCPARFHAAHSRFQCFPRKTNMGGGLISTANLLLLIINAYW